MSNRFSRFSTNSACCCLWSDVPDFLLPFIPGFHSHVPSVRNVRVVTVVPLCCSVRTVSVAVNVLLQRYSGNRIYVRVIFAILFALFLEFVAKFANER